MQRKTQRRISHAVPIRYSWPMGGHYTSQLFTGNGTWTVPAGLRLAYVTVVGGGGSGGSSSYTLQAGGGGGSGGMVYRLPFFLDTVLTSVSVTVGLGGASTLGPNPGGNSTFGSYITCTGGTGGIEGRGNPDFTDGEGGNGGSATINASRFVGASGTDAGQVGDITDGIGWTFVQRPINQELSFRSERVMWRGWYSGGASGGGAATPGGDGDLGGLGFASKLNRLNSNLDTDELVGYSGGAGLCGSGGSYSSDPPTGWGAGGGAEPADNINNPTDGYDGMVLVEWWN